MPHTDLKCKYSWKTKSSSTNQNKAIPSKINSLHNTSPLKHLHIFRHGKKIQRKKNEKGAIYNKTLIWAVTMLNKRRLIKERGCEYFDYIYIFTFRILEIVNWINTWKWIQTIQTIRSSWDPDTWQSSLRSWLSAIFTEILILYNLFKDQLYWVRNGLKSMMTEELDS